MEKKIFLAWLPFALALTVTCGLVEVAVQQNYRQMANDPQIQMVEDAVVQLNGGVPPQAVTTPQPVQIEKSLSPFYLVFDDKGKTIAGTGALEGKLPSFPSGVFVNAKNGEKSFTWQPQKSVRQAVVMMPFKGEVQTASGTAPSSGFIAASRSLRETEKRETQTVMLVAISWLIGLLLSYIAVRLAYKSISRAMHHAAAEGHHEAHSHQHAAHHEE